MTPRGGPRNLLHPGPPYLRATPPAAPAPPPLHRSGHLASPASSAHPHRLPRRRCRQRSSSAHGLITPQARTQNGGGVVQCACVGAAGAAGADKGRDGGGGGGAGQATSGGRGRKGEGRGWRRAAWEAAPGANFQKRARWRNGTRCESRHAARALPRSRPVARGLCGRREVRAPPGWGFLGGGRRLWAVRDPGSA